MAITTAQLSHIRRILSLSTKAFTDAAITEIWDEGETSYGAGNSGLLLAYVKTQITEIQLNQAANITDYRQAQSQQSASQYYRQLKERHEAYKKELEDETILLQGNIAFGNLSDPIPLKHVEFPNDYITADFSPSDLE